jgi:hypothetical protein
VVTAHTDAGRPISLGAPDRPRAPPERAEAARRLLGALGFAGRVTRERPPSDASNCHGWVFAAGRYRVHPMFVTDIPPDNGYRPAARPRPGGVVVYYGGPHRAVWHSGVVREVGPGGVTVESKWNWMGVYRHDVNDSPYGTDYVFPRTPRPGHVLAGLGGSPPPTHPDPAGAGGH